MKIFFLNGQKYQILIDLDIKQVLEYFNYQNEIFIIEYNNEIYNKRTWEHIYILNNDRIEIITIVGGG